MHCNSILMPSRKSAALNEAHIIKFYQHTIDYNVEESIDRLNSIQHELRRLGYNILTQHVQWHWNRNEQRWKGSKSITTMEWLIFDARFLSSSLSLTLFLSQTDATDQHQIEHTHQWKWRNANENTVFRPQKFRRFVRFNYANYWTKVWNQNCSFLFHSLSIRRHPKNHRPIFGAVWRKGLQMK